MKTKEFLKQHSACKDGAKWALSISEEMVDVWDELIKQEKWEWLLWTITRPEVFPDTVLRKLACRFIRETPLHDGRTVWDLLTDERSMKAVEVAEAYTDGKATKEDMDAAYAAARAAYYTAARAAAYDDASSAAYAAARDAAYAADAADAVADAAYAADAADSYDAYTAADAAYVDARASADAAYAHAKAAQIKMISEVGNPFKEEQKDEYRK